MKIEVKYNIGDKVRIMPDKAVLDGVVEQIRVYVVKPVDEVIVKTWYHVDCNGQIYKVREYEIHCSTWRPGKDD